MLLLTDLSWLQCLEEAQPALKRLRLSSAEPEVSTRDAAASVSVCLLLSAGRCADQSLAPVHASCRLMRSRHSRHSRSSRRAGCRMKPQRAYHTICTSSFITTVTTAPATPT